MTDHEQIAEAAYRRGYFHGYAQGIDDICLRRRTHGEANNHLIDDLLDWRCEASSGQPIERTPPPVMADDNNTEGKASE